MFRPNQTDVATVTFSTPVLDYDFLHFPPSFILSTDCPKIGKYPKHPKNGETDQTVQRKASLKERLGWFRFGLNPLPSAGQSSDQ